MITINADKLTTDDVLSVYSGKDKKCCCGCSGKHSYSSKFVVEAGLNRGYDVKSEEVSDAQITRVLNIIKKNSEIAEFAYDHVAVVVGARIYIAYLATEETMSRVNAEKARTSLTVPAQRS